ncbi:MAG: choice-of-anchor L domain-containing protein, partial [Bacteroidales bacterium]|nr:choice-of-anchor L domain-containing protein [Bacteroidales bacterium]
MRGISKLKQYIVFVFIFFIFISFASAQVDEDIVEKRKRLSNISQNHSGEAPKSAKGLLTTDADKTVAELVETLLGAGFKYGIEGDPGVNVFNASLIGPGIANGFFDGNGSQINMSDGIIFTSGALFTADGPNDTYNQTGSSSGAGDDDLTALVAPTYVTHGAAGIEFDFIPESDEIEFEYVFGSEEYPEFINGGYNDVFAFFLSGPDPDGGVFDKKNIALIPGTNLPITIESVNEEDNSEYYHINQWSSGFHLTNVGFDGFTTVLTAVSSVVPCETYHIKIAVADAGDNTWDSGVFLKSNSFSSAPVTIVPIYGNAEIPSVVEDCNEADMVFTLEEALPNNIIVPFSFSSLGTAEYGVDFTTDPVVDPDNASITIPAGSLSQAFTIIPITDALDEGTETIIIEYSYNSPCSTDPETATVTIEIKDRTEVVIFPSGNLSLTCGESTTLEVQAKFGFPDYSYSWDTGETGISINVSPLEDTQYTITVNDECNSESFYIFDVEVERPIAEITGALNPICIGDDIELTASGGGTYNWSPGGSTTPSITVSPTFTKDYTVTVTTDPGCFDSETVTVTVNPLPVVDHVDISGICIDVTDYELLGGSPISGIYSGNHVSSGEFNAALAFADAGLGDYPVLYTYTDGNGCINDKTFQVNITDQIEVNLNDLADICENAAAITLTGGDPTGGSFSGLGVDEATNKFNPSLADIGINPITYTYISGSCSGTDIKNINVLAKPSVSLDPTKTEFCYTGDDFEIDGNVPSGGNLSGNGVDAGWFDPTGAGLGLHDIFYSIQGTNGCFNSTNTQFEVFGLPYTTFLNLPFETPCSDNPPFLLDKGS